MMMANLKTKEEVNMWTRKTIKPYYQTANLAEQIHQLANLQPKVKMMILIHQTKESVAVKGLYKCMLRRKDDHNEIIINKITYKNIELNLNS